MVQVLKNDFFKSTYDILKINHKLLDITKGEHYDNFA